MKPAVFTTRVVAIYAQSTVTSICWSLGHCKQNAEMAEALLHRCAVLLRSGMRDERFRGNSVEIMTLANTLKE